MSRSIVAYDRRSIRWSGSAAGDYLGARCGICLSGLDWVKDVVREWELKKRELEKRELKKRELKKREAEKKKKAEVREGVNVVGG